MSASTTRTIHVSIDEIAHDVRAYLQYVAAGKTVVIMNAGHPVAELTSPTQGDSALRPMGLAAGAFVVPDDFDAPLPEDFLNDFEHR